MTMIKIIITVETEEHKDSVLASLNDLEEDGYLNFSFGVKTEYETEIKPFSKAEWFADDIDAAKTRADEINGVVIFSKPPESADTTCNGYWVDEKDSMVRTWETVIYVTPHIPYRRK